jgi:uncharacterized membrane protein YbhN (UPF0104 family)
MNSATGKPSAFQLVTWLVGLLTVVGLTVIFDAEAMLSAVMRIPLWAIAAWSALTIASRVAAALVTLVPVRALGGDISLLESFCIGWTRTFLNQVVPVSGVAYSAGFIRERSGLSWGQVSALAAPLYAYAVVATGIFGVCAVASNVHSLGAASIPLLGLFIPMIAALRVLDFVSSNERLRFLRKVKSRLQPTFRSVQVLRDRKGLTSQIVALHGAALGFRAARLWVLFVALGLEADIAHILMLSSLGEVAFLVQLTPGGLGLREGALVSGSMLIPMAPQAIAVVAIVDRVLAISIVTICSPLALWYTAHSSKRKASPIVSA